MSSHYMLALDQGTTSSRSMLFDKQGNILSTAQKEFRQIRRDRRLAISLILPPTLQLLLFGFLSSVQSV